MKTKIFNIPINLGSTTLIVDKKVPTFELETTNGDVFSNQSLLGTRYIISTFPNVNTKVCKIQTRTMIQEFSNYENTLLFNLATNSKESFNSWCAVQGLQALMVSDPKVLLGKKFGLKMPLVDMYARAVFLVDQEGYIRYVEVMENVSDEPDYKKLRDHLLSL